MAKESSGDHSQSLRPDIEKPDKPALRGFSIADDPKRADRTLLDSKPDDAAETPQVATEDTFVPPPAKIDHSGPPNDPNAPSGSLSSDDAEAIAVDFSAASPAHPK
jgi:hypothetical protein